MGQTGFCKIMRFPAVFCEDLWFPAVFCDTLHLRNAVFPGKTKISKNHRKSTKTANSTPFVQFKFVPLNLIPLQYRERGLFCGCVRSKAHWLNLVNLVSAMGWARDSQLWLTAFRQFGRERVNSELCESCSAGACKQGH